MENPRPLQTLQVEHLWQCVDITHPSLSPDGAWALVSQTKHSLDSNASQTDLWLYSIDGTQTKQLTRAGVGTTPAKWSPDGTKVAFCAQRAGDTTQQLYVIAVDGGEARRVTTLSSGVTSIRWFPDNNRLAGITMRWPDLKTDAEQVVRRNAMRQSPVTAHIVESDGYRYWGNWRTSGTVPQLIQVDLDSGNIEYLFSGKPWSLKQNWPDTDYDISPDGKEVVWVNTDDSLRFVASNSLMRLTLKTRKVKRIDFGNVWLASPTYSRSGRAVAVLATPAEQPCVHTQLLMIVLGSGVVTRQCATWPRSVGTYGQTRLAWVAGDHAILFTAEDAGAQHLYSLSLGNGEPTVIARGGHITSFALCARGVNTVFVRSSIDYPVRLFAMSADGEDRLDSANALIDKLSLGRWEQRWFKGWRRSQVQAFVCYPPSYDARKKYPLVQVIHGGPHMAMLDAWSQRLSLHAVAAQGYVVAAVNYHGSTGYGEKFLGSIDGDMGPREFADIEAFTDSLVADGVVDGEKLFAMGGSYGGYMVAWINGHTDRYQALVCHAGLYNVVSGMSADSYMWKKQELGVWPWDDPARVLAQSPHSYVRRFKTPTLVIHGDLDYRVPCTQGLEHYNTLRAKGIAAKLLVYPDEGHWITKPQNSLLWYREVFAWLKRFQ